jgi:hypothetical protein
MLRPPWPTVLVTLALASACAAPERQAKSDSTSATPSLGASDTVSIATPPSSDSARVLFWSFVSRLGESRSEVIAALGAPISKTGDTLRNWHDTTVVDSLVTLRYPKLEVEFFVGVGGKEFPTVVSVSDSNVRLPIGIGIGATQLALERVFGGPDFRTVRGDSVFMRFSVPGEVDNELVFVLVANAVRKIEWAYYVD